MSWNEFASGYLRFSKKDRIAAILFSSAILAVYLLPRFFPKTPGVAVTEDTTLSRLLDTAAQLAQNNAYDKPENEPGQYQYEFSKKSDFTTGALFQFDPNKLPAEGWKKLGLQDRTVKTILNYRSKGGHFYKDADLKKIWGLPDGFYERVRGHIQITDAKKEYVSNTNFFKTPYEKSERRIAAVDINNADTTALIALPGIGSKLAQRIITFRDKLGGFYAADQIGETYGLPDSTFQKLKPYLKVYGDFKKFNINTATKDELKTHPYIKWNLANAIVEYRAQHGLFKKLDEVKNIVLIDEEIYKKITPYLSL